MNKGYTLYTRVRLKSEYLGLQFRCFLSPLLCFLHLEKADDDDPSARMEEDEAAHIWLNLALSLSLSLSLHKWSQCMPNLWHLG